MSLFIFILVAAVGIEKVAAECQYTEGFKQHWTRTRKMLTDIVAAMPEDKWDYRPVKEVRSFREMVLHLVQDGYVHLAPVANLSDDETKKLINKTDHLQTKAELLAALNDYFGWGEHALDSITEQTVMETVLLEGTEKMTRFEAVEVAFEDQMDHYGNFVVYLRINGIVPPASIKTETH